MRKKRSFQALLKILEHCRKCLYWISRTHTSIESYLILKKFRLLEKITPICSEEHSEAVKIYPLAPRDESLGVLKDTSIIQKDAARLQRSGFKMQEKLRDHDVPNLDRSFTRR